MSSELLTAALWYVEHQATHVHISKAPSGEYCYIVLRHDNALEAKKINPRDEAMYLEALQGRKDKRIKDHAHLMDVCYSFHYVHDLCEGDDDIAECEGNKARLRCLGCKGFAARGICAHVLAINHILKEYNVRYNLLTVNKKGKKGGQRATPTPALTRMPRTDDGDSSEEEEQRALALGAEGN